MNIGNSNITFTDLNKKTGTASINCALELGAYINRVTIGSLETTTSGLNDLAMTIDALFDLLDNGELTGVNAHWKDTSVAIIRQIDEPDGEIRIIMGGFTFTYRQLLELIVEIDSAVNDIISDYNKE